MKAFNLANQLTVLRMILIPFFLLAVSYDHLGWALAIFVLAGMTDGLDGIIARWWKQQTSLGEYLDPMADKLLLSTAFLILTFPTVNYEYVIPPWLTVLVISRDVLIVLSVLILALTTEAVDFQPSIYGKINTICQITTIFLTLIRNVFRLNSFALDIIFGLAIWLTLLFVLLSGFHYIHVAALKMYERNGNAR